MLTISKPLSSSQAQTYHAKEFVSAEQNYWKQGDLHPRRMAGPDGRGWYGLAIEPSPSSTSPVSVRARIPLTSASRSWCGTATDQRVHDRRRNDCVKTRRAPAPVGTPTSIFSAKSPFL